MSETLKIFNDTLLFSFSTMISQAVSMVLAVYIRSMLGPEAMGIWAILQVLQSYANYTNLGVMNAVFREIPVLKGRGGMAEKIEEMKNVGYSYVGIVSFVTAIGLVAAAFILRGRISDLIFYGLLTVALITVLERTVGYLVQTLYVERNFKLVSRFRLYSSAANAVFTLWLVWQFGLPGFYGAIILSFLFDYAYLKRRSGLAYRWCLKLRPLWGLISFGLPVTLLAFCSTFFNTMDRVVIGRFLGLEELGVYTLALLAGRYIFLLPNMFQIVLLPNTLEKFGQEYNEAGRKNYSVLPGRLMAAYFSACLAIIWVAAPLICRFFLPKFAAGVPALKALIFAYAFMALSQQMGHILLGFRRHLRMIPVAIFSAGLLWAAGGHWISIGGGGILEIAILMTGLQIFYYLFSSWWALEKMFSAGEVVSHLVLNLLPFVFSAFVLCSFDRLWPEDSLVSMAVKAVIYFVLWFGFFAWIEPRTGVLKLLFQTFRDWLKISFQS